MNAKEVDILERMAQNTKDLTAAVSNFKIDITKRVEGIEKVHAPLHFEESILQESQIAVGKAIRECLISYNSPLTKLVHSVVEEHTSELRQMISDSFTKVIRTDDFKASILNAFSHKVARTIISNNDGLFDKVSNELKQDSVFKAKMALAVSNVVEECLKEKGETK